MQGLVGMHRKTAVAGVEQRDEIPEPRNHPTENTAPAANQGGGREFGASWLRLSLDHDGEILTAEAGPESQYPCGGSQLQSKPGGIVLCVHVGVTVNPVNTACSPDTCSALLTLPSYTLRHSLRVSVHELN